MALTNLHRLKADHGHEQPTDPKEKVRIGRFILPLNIEHSKSSFTQGKFYIFLITHT